MHMSICPYVYMSIYIGICICICICKYVCLPFLLFLFFPGIFCVFAVFRESPQTIDLNRSESPQICAKRA